MSVSKNLELLQGDGGEPEDRHHRLDLAIQVLEARADREFQISERLEGKARQAFALVAAFFAVAQAVTFGSFRAGKLSGTELIILAVWAGLSACLVAATGYFLAHAEGPQRETDIQPAAIERWAKEDDDVKFARQLVVELKRVAESRHEGNETRKDQYKILDLVARSALILTTVEMLFAVAFRA